MASPAPPPAPAGALEPSNDNDGKLATTITNPRYAQALHDGHLKGNFQDYYAFHPFAPRVTALLGASGTPARELKQEMKGVLQHILHRAKEGGGNKPLLVADWGCNSGDLTAALCRRLRELQPDRRVVGLGLDLDANLIKRANSKYSDIEEGVDVIFAAVDLVSEWSRAEELMRAFLKEQQASDVGGEKEAEQEKGVPRRKFDLLTIFSTTMWIHLVHGEQTLKDFLVHASEWTHCLAIEPQTHKNYKTARKRLKRVGLQPCQHFDAIADSEYPHMLMTCADRGFMGAFEGSMNMGKSSDWGRELHIFWKKEEGKEEKVEGEENTQKELNKKREREEEMGQEGGGAGADGDPFRKADCLTSAS